MTGPYHNQQRQILLVGSIAAAILTCTHGNSADSATASRLAEISSHGDTLAARHDARMPLMRSSADGVQTQTRTETEASPTTEEAMLTRNMFPLPPQNLLSLNEPRRFTFSEDHEDLLLQPLLKNIHAGFYVESGAFDGEKGSNTLYFERKRGWTGLLVEPSPLNVPKLRAKGRQAYVFSGCLSDTVEQAWLGDILGSNGEHGHLTPQEDSAAHPVPVTCAPLPNLLKLIGRTVVDLWSLNVEGSEVRVLNAMDFHNVEVGVLLVAAHTAHNVDAAPQITSIMQGHGFEEVGRRSPGGGKPSRITFVNPTYFLKRGLAVPKDQRFQQMLKLSAPTKPDAAQNSTIAEKDHYPGMSPLASIPLILVVGALSVICCLKADVKGPSDC